MCQPAFVPRKVLYLAAAGLLLIALAAVCLLAGRGISEPEHDGRPLSFWLQQRVPSSANLPWPWELSDDGAHAVRQIGTNCLPTLLHWMSYPERGVRDRMFLWLRSKGVSPVVLQSAYPRSYRPDFAILGMRALGPEARGAIPALVKMIGKEQDAQWAAYALCTIGPEGTAGLSGALEHIDGFARANVLLGLQSGIWLDREADVTPVLTARLTNDPSASVRGSAALVLRKFTHSGALVVPALARALHDGDGSVRFRAAESLVFFGAEAAPALPALKEALSDESPTVRDFAAQVIRQIGTAENEKAR